MLFHALIENYNEKNAYVQVFYAHAAHLGEALEKIIKAAISIGMKNPIWRQADPTHHTNLPKDLKKFEKLDVFWSDQKYYYEREETLELPYGIISSTQEGENFAADILKGFTLYKDKNSFILNANLCDQELAQTYYDLLEEYKNFTVFWYRIHDHWGEDEKNEIYTNENLDSSSKIINYLNMNLDNTIKNGFVTLTSFIKDGSTNININDHKQIEIYTLSEAQLEIAIKFFTKKNLEKFNNLLSINNNIFHWHFRAPSCSNRTELIEKLKHQDFEYWEPNLIS